MRSPAVLLVLLLAAAVTVQAAVEAPTQEWLLQWPADQPIFQEPDFCGSGSLYRVMPDDADFESSELRARVYTRDEEDPELQRLLREGWTVVARSTGRPFQMVHQELLQEARKRAKLTGTAIPNGYHDPKQLLLAFEQLQAQNPGLVEVVELNRVYNTPNTIEGRSLYAAKVSLDVGLDHFDRPNVLVVSNHHSRELVTPELTLNLAQRLVAGARSGDLGILALLAQYQVYIMPTVNPDGLNHVWTRDNMWRKNRRQNHDGSFGVDLNRGYGMGWDLSCGGSTVPRAEDYRGSSALSEAETLTMVAFQRERRFAKVLDLHSYAREVRSIYGSCASLPRGIDQFFIEEGKILAAMMPGYVQARSCCTGGNVHQAYRDMHSWTYLVETATAFQPDLPAVKDEIERTWAGIMGFLERAIPLRGVVTDAQTGKPLQAEIRLLNWEGQWTNAERIQSHGERGGWFHVWAPAGRLELTIRAPGFAELRTSVELPSDRSSLRKDFALVRA